MNIEKTVNIESTPINTREVNDKISILREAQERASNAVSYYRTNYKISQEDVDFLYSNNREFIEVDEDNRLHLLFNRLPQFINRVVGAQRNEVQSITIVPTEQGFATKMITETGKTLDVTEAIEDIVRDIEYRSNAVAAYKLAFKHALEGGFGWCRVLTKYKKDSFDLDIEIKSIRDRWSVLVDPKAKEPDLSDMRYAFITEKMSHKEFNKRYPGKSTESITETENTNIIWSDDETVTVAEYFRREPYKKTLALLSTGEVVEKKLIDEKQLAEQGISIVRTRTTTDYKVVWCKITAGDILEPEVEFPTSTIPIVPFFGRVVDLKDKTLYLGLIHDAKGSQTALNKMLSSALERIDESPLSPWIASDKAIEGYENIWAESNIKKYSVLPYRKGEEPPHREPGATVPVAELNLLPELDNSIKSSIGIFNASLGQRSNETSGVAIRSRQQEGDIGTYEFIDNYRMAIRRIGLLVVEMLPKVYDTERQVVLRREDDTTDVLILNKQIQDPNTGATIIVNTLNNAKYDVKIVAGATYNTKREENAQQILQLMQVNPDVAKVGSDLLVRNLDFSESNILADRLEKTIPPQLLSPKKREQLQQEMQQGQPQQQQQPSPEQVKADAEIQKVQLQLEIEKIKLEEAKLKLQTEQLQAAHKSAMAEVQRKNHIADSVAKSINIEPQGNRIQGGQNV